MSSVSVSSRIEYRTWRSIKSRCYNKSSLFFPVYGGAGIKMCDEWKNSFSAFIQHVGWKPKAGMRLTRKDKSKDYAPGNVEWKVVRSCGRKRGYRKWKTAELQRKVLEGAA